MPQRLNYWTVWLMDACSVDADTAFAFRFCCYMFAVLEPGLGATIVVVNFSSSAAVSCGPPPLLFRKFDLVAVTPVHLSLCVVPRCGYRPLLHYWNYYYRYHYPSEVQGVRPLAFLEGYMYGTGPKFC